MAASPGSGSISSTSCGAPSDPNTAPPQRLLYGRRHGRPLRPGRKALIGELLPQLAVTLPGGGKLDLEALFGTPRPVWLEIGFGGGEHLARQAETHREIGFLGCEVFESGIGKLIVGIAARRLANIRIFADDARLLIAALPASSVDRVFILFPDPWPKARHRKRRLISAETLDELARIMPGGAELRLATDDIDYLSWMLDHVTRHPAFAWLARRPADWRERPADWPATRYEAKARAAGRAPFFLRIARRP
jgi:tRNA (guanine-N7-)-methyltransferase